MKNKKLLPALVAGFFIPAATATAAVRPLPLPCPGGFPDGESTVIHPLGGWNDETAFAILTLSTVASPTGGVEVAFGIDRNADGDLAPEETELRVGCDCGEWFVRDERTERTALADPAEPGRDTRAFTARMLPRLDGVAGEDGKGPHGGYCFRIKVPMFAVDSSTTKLTMNSFDWAQHRRSKAAAKLHLTFDLGNRLPSFAARSGFAGTSSKRCASMGQQDP